MARRQVTARRVEEWLNTDAMCVRTVAALVIMATARRAVTRAYSAAVMSLLSVGINVIPDADACASLAWPIVVPAS